MTYHYAWLTWSSAFLVPWLALYWAFPAHLKALSGVLIYGLPLEELLFGFSFGLFWTGVYEHFTWKKSIDRGMADPHATSLAQR